MAIYRLSASYVKRSEGRSVVACAAYRAGVALDHERTGQSFDYRRRRGVLHAEILAPVNAPAWIRDRAQLWNRIEAIERRKDAQLAREIQLALPHELDAAARIELVRGYVVAELVSLGMVADVALHAPGDKGDERNFHAHVLLTLRPVEGEGFGDKCRAWNETERLEQWRAAWADHVNRALEDAKVMARVDHRSLAGQGIDRAPQLKLGFAVREMQRQGIATERADLAHEIAGENAARQEIADELQAVTRQIAVLGLLESFRRFAEALTVRRLWRRASTIRHKLVRAHRRRATGPDIEAPLFDRVALRR
jgi:ATP-dependent exoDNAse (exonuclease V) alpha subunit